MSLAASLIAVAGVALLLVTFAGLIVRGRWRQWYAFALYLPVMAGFSLVFVAWPDVWTPSGWVVQANVLNAVRFAVALELAARTFRSFPGARSTLRPILLILLIFTFAAVTAFPSSALDYETFLNDLQPRLLNGTVWLFTAIAALILWYRLPVAPLHKSILLGYVPYLLFQLVYLRAFVTRSWQLPLLGYLNQAAYLLLVSHWAWVAWRADVPLRTDRPGLDDQGPRGSGPHTMARVSDGRHGIESIGPSRRPTC
jgi:hypothetical protein